jgi:hypothetical protein
VDTNPELLAIKRTTISDKLRETVLAIEQRGSANLGRLTVIKNGLRFQITCRHSRSSSRICVLAEDENH